MLGHDAERDCRGGAVDGGHARAQRGAGLRIRLRVGPFDVREVLVGRPVLADEVGVDGCDVLEHVRREGLGGRRVLVETRGRGVEDCELGGGDNQVRVEDLSAGVHLLDDGSDRQVLVFERTGQVSRRLPVAGDVVVAPRLEGRARGKEFGPLRFDFDGVSDPVLEGERPVAEATVGFVDEVFLVGGRVHVVGGGAVIGADQRGRDVLQRKAVGGKGLGDPRVVGVVEVAREPRGRQLRGSRHVVGDLCQADLGTARKIHQGRGTG